jgi:hypothetical protein
VAIKAAALKTDDVRIVWLPTDALVFIGSRETLNEYSMDESCSRNPMLFAGEGARATLVQSFPSNLYWVAG